MARKIKPSLEEAINLFEDSMQRCTLIDYLHVNRTLISKTKNDNSVLVIPDQSLWEGLLEKSNVKDHFKPLDLNRPDHQQISSICKYGNDLANEAWVDADSELLYKGKVIKIKVDGLDYSIDINKNLIPLKLKKAEFNNIAYRVFLDDRMFVLKKRFDYALEDLGFTIIRLFKIV